MEGENSGAVVAPSAGAEDEVMSEVHLGCPPNFSGPYISHFTFSLPPTQKFMESRYDGIINDELTSAPQDVRLDDDGDLVLTRRSMVINDLNSKYEDVECRICLAECCTATTTAGPPPSYFMGFVACCLVHSCLLKDLRIIHQEHQHPSDLRFDLHILKHEQSKNSFVMTIQHSITSSIPSVGLQVWRAELVLADFVLHKIFTSSQFDGTVAVELGAGTGLVGMLLAHVAKAVFLTDHGDDVLKNCAKNVHLNSRRFCHRASVYVRELDWKASWPPQLVEDSPSRESFAWTSSEIEGLHSASLLVAADVIYSDDLTDAFFVTLERLMSLFPEKVLYLALEKRYNFTLDDLGVVANGYSHFQSYLSNETECDDLQNGSSPCFVGTCIDLEQIPQYARDYDRGQDVELWQIKFKKRKP